ncbi:Gfo/Idh/MocA family protein [Paenibacillus sp. strain BS8-2]
MKIAVLGCGGMGQVHANIYANMNGVELTCVCDDQLSSAEHLASITGASAYSSFETMLAQADFEVVSITLPSHLHKAYTLLAAQAGKHIICEKPIALTLEDAADMIRCCEENGVRLFIGHVVRFFPEYVNMKQALEQGRIGRPGVAHASRIGAHPGPSKPWFAQMNKSGGVIVDLMIHDLDFLRWTLGEVSTVYGLNRNQKGLDYALVTLQFESGVVANVEANWGFPGPFHTKAEIAGSEGIVVANSLKNSSLQVFKTNQDGASDSISSSPGFHSPYELQLNHFVQCIRTGEEAIVTPEDAYRALELALAALESVRTGKAVHLQGGQNHA